MARKYDSSRRQEAARETRRRILEAALRLHWDGITEYEPLAREAGCSVATVRKHFPNREVLFRDCTRTFAESLTLPDLVTLGRIEDPDRRMEECVSEVCRIHEAMFGYAWLCVRQREDSPTLDSELRAYEGLADATAQLLAPDDVRGVVRALLDFLTYRAFRLSGDRSPQSTRDELVALVRAAIHRSSQVQERPKP
jgi:AcrR family transcriptional regulator